MKLRSVTVALLVAMLISLLAPSVQTYAEEKDQSGSLGHGEWAFRPLKVNIQLNLENEGDEDHIYGILNEIEARGWQTTVFVTGEFASKYPDVAKDIQDRGHQVAVYGWEKGEDLTILNYTEQLDWMSKSFSAVRRAVGKPEEVVDFKPQGYQFNNDTLQAEVSPIL